MNVLAPLRVTHRDGFTKFGKKAAAIHGKPSLSLDTGSDKEERGLYDTKDVVNKATGSTPDSREVLV